MPWPKRRLRASNSAACTAPIVPIPVTADSATAARICLSFIVCLLGGFDFCKTSADACFVDGRLHTIAEQTYAFYLNFTYVARLHVQTGFACVPDASGSARHNDIAGFQCHDLADRDDKRLHIENHVLRIG